MLSLAPPPLLLAPLAGFGRPLDEDEDEDAGRPLEWNEEQKDERVMERIYIVFDMQFI